MLFAPIILLAALTGADLLDEVHQIPAGDWKFVEIKLHQRPARIFANYEVLNGSDRVPAALMLREDLERMSEDLPGNTAITGEGKRGHFSDSMRRNGDFVVVLDNQEGKVPATVRLRVGLDFGASTGPEVTRLTPQRRFAVVAISCAVFFGIVGFSARRLY